MKRELIQYVGRVWLTAEDYCRALMIHRATLSKWIGKGKVTSAKLRGTLLIEVGGEKNIANHLVKKDRVRVGRA